VITSLYSDNWDKKVLGLEDFATKRNQTLSYISNNLASIILLSKKNIDLLVDRHIHLKSSNWLVDFCQNNFILAKHFHFFSLIAVFLLHLLHSVIVTMLNRIEV